MTIPFVKAEHVGTAVVQEKETSTTTRIKTTQIKGFVNKYFYFCMSLLFAALVVWGFSRTINDNLLHAALPGPCFSGFTAPYSRVG
jgi:hypothetical protein